MLRVNDYPTQFREKTFPRYRHIYNEQPNNHLGLLCIDLQDPFIRTIPNQDRLIQRCSFAIEAAKLLGVSIAATEQIPEKLSQTTKSIRAILHEHTPIFSKSTFSAFEAEGIDRWIQAEQIDHLLIIGLETSICVYQTAIDALGDDIGVTILSDCVSQRRERIANQFFNNCFQWKHTFSHLKQSFTAFLGVQITQNFGISQSL